MWKGFWRQHTVENFQLHTPLGAWTETPHREWEWFYDKKGDCLQRKEDMTTDHFLAVGSARTRSKKNYIKLWTD